MSNKKKHIDELHFEHSLWRNQLRFSKDELKSYQIRLEEIAKKNTNNEVLALVEQFQNKFIRQNEVIDELLHDINVHEDSLAQAAKNNPDSIHHQLFDNHDKMEGSAKSFLSIYNELKKDYYSFSAKWM